MSYLTEKILKESSNQSIAAVKFWTTGGHRIIRAMATGTAKDYKDAEKVYGSDFGKRKKESKGYYEKFVSFLSRLKPFTGQVYRGIHIPKKSLETFLVKYKKGSVVSLPYSSATKNYKVGREFSASTSEGNYVGIFYMINSKSARDISKWADKEYKWQEEIVILDNSKYKVTDLIIPKGTKKWCELFNRTYHHQPNEKKWLTPITIYLDEVS